MSSAPSIYTFIKVDFVMDTIYVIKEFLGTNCLYRYRDVHVTGLPEMQWYKVKRMILFRGNNFSALRFR